jgi:hypothetical protein
VHHILRPPQGFAYLKKKTEATNGWRQVIDPEFKTSVLPIWYIYVTYILYYIWDTFSRNDFCTMAAYEAPRPHSLIEILKKSETDWINLTGSWKAIRHVQHPRKYPIQRQLKKKSKGKQGNTMWLTKIKTTYQRKIVNKNTCKYIF